MDVNICTDVTCLLISKCADTGSIGCLQCHTNIGLSNIISQIKKSYNSYKLNSRVTYRHRDSSQSFDKD